MSERIDAHHHLWHYRRDDYPWIRDDMEVLARDFLETELEQEASGCRIDGTVAVQARQSVDETLWLLKTAETSRLIRGVVGWAPIASPEFPKQLSDLQMNPKLKGLRHLIQDEPDDEFILRPDFNRGIAELQPSGLVYDILIFERHLPAAISFVDRHPNQMFVLDHIGKPRIAQHQLEPWRANVRELARRQNVYCKLSGLVTEADWIKWQPADLRPYVQVVLDAFGPSRILAGSDWPVCLLAAGYDRWFFTLGQFLASLSAAEQGLIYGEVAASVYQLPAATPTSGAQGRR
jgi:L-fuconolactonase